MSPITHFTRWAAATALASLCVAGPIVAAQGDPSPGNQGSPPPQIDSYQPFPAAWDQPITIHGSNLLPWVDPSGTALTQQAKSGAAIQKSAELVDTNALIEADPFEPSTPSSPAPEGSKPVLKVGGEGKKAHFVIPASDIESWTSTEIRIKKLSGGWAGAYWIAVYQNGKRVSNRNRTLFFAENDPNATLTLAELPPPGSEEEEEEPLRVKIAYPPVQEPSEPQTYVFSYQPNVVGAGDEVELFGAFFAQGNRSLYFGAGNRPLGRIPPEKIKEWTFNTIRFDNEFLPTGVYWIAIFEGQQPISNLVQTLQVTEDPPPAPPNESNPSQIIQGLRKLSPSNPGGSEAAPGGKRVLQRMPGAPGAGAAQKPMTLQRRMQPSTRVKGLQPKTGAIRGPTQAPTSKPAKVEQLRKQPQANPKAAHTAPIAPAREGAPQKILQPSKNQPRVLQQR